MKSRWVERRASSCCTSSVPNTLNRSLARSPKPALMVPESIRKAGVHGSVEVLLDVGADGKVGDVRVVKPLHAEADAACVSAWESVRCAAGRLGESPVGVTGLPHTCTFRLVE